MKQISGFARLWAAVALVLALFLGVTVALTFTRAPDDGEADSSALAATEGSQEVDVVLTEFALSPADITVEAGRPVTFRLRNEGSIEHDLSVEGVADSEDVAPGEEAVFEVEALEPGTYALLCSLAGHSDAGMVGTLTVTEAGAGADAGAGAGEAADGAAEPAAHDMSEMTPDEMAAKHDDLSGYPAETEGQGNQPLEPTVDEDGTKVFELTASEIEWETAPGEWQSAMAYNGQVPGPRIDVDLGDRVRIVVNNELSVPTSLHLHGLVLPNEMDGVPGLTQDSILPGDSFTYELTVDNAGSHMYHSHFDSANQVPGGLLGAFIVHHPDDPEVDHDEVMILNDGPLGYTVNGKGFPATPPLTVEEGETIRIRYMNEGLQIHPMHLHGMPQQVVANDGYPLESPHMADNVLVSPGDRVDVLVEATEPGGWAWHCHILSHAEGPEGMFGMVTALIVE